MPIDPVQRLINQMQELQDRVKTLETRPDQQSMAVDRGATHILSDEGLIVGAPGSNNGSEIVYGVLRIIGQLIGEGQITWSGPWTLSGAGDITGDVDISGDLDLTGNLEVLGGGRIKVGNVVLTPGNGGRITIGTGSSQIIIDPSQLKVGPAFKMDPAHSSDGAQQEFGLNGRATLFGSNTLLSLLLKNSGGDVIAGASLQPNVGSIGTGPGVAINGMLHVPDTRTLPTGVTARYLALGSDGIVYATSGTGGGGGSGPGPIAGSFMWPFSQSTTDPVLGFYGMRLNPVTGEWRLHAGQDFSVAYGSSIPAAGDGQISAVGFDSGRGNYVVIDHGNGITTHYFHMAALSQLQVGDNVERGARIGAVGSTGNSTGPHLHWETHVNGTAIDPRVFMANQEG